MTMFSVDYFSSSVSAADDSADPLRNYTNTFLLSSRATPLREAPQRLNVDPGRQRRSHQKSRTGCESCKRRRVKCNEETPCANCVHRGESCRRVQRQPGKPPASKSSLSGILRPKQVDSALDLGHLQLLHHFQTHTIETLLIAPQAWESALQLGFQFDFLMNTILCVAARHLSILQPLDSTHATVAANYLCRALSGLRYQIAHNFHKTHIDAFIATSLLLQIEVWANKDYLSLHSLQHNSNPPFEPAQDHLFVFCSSLKRVFLQNVPQILGQESVFRPHLAHNPTDALVKSARIDSATLAQYQGFFAYDGPINEFSLEPPLPSTRGEDLAISCAWHQATSHAVKDISDPVHDGYKRTITRLCLILSYLPEADPPVSTTDPFLSKEMARYIMSFPVSCYGPFASMVEQSDPHAILLLYHFYRAANQLLRMNQYWWVRGRASTMEKVLRDWLNQQFHSKGLLNSQAIASG